MQTKIEVSPFLGVVPSVVEIGTRLKELLSKREELVNKIDKDWATGTYSQHSVVSYYLLEKELQSLREQLLLRAEDTPLVRDYLQYHDVLKARLPKCVTYLVE